MKKVIAGFVMFFSVCVLLAGINFWKEDKTALAPKKSCTGYIVIAVDKGIDCNGDTIQLVKEHGYFKFVSKLSSK
jgi:hypothetical protein